MGLKRNNSLISYNKLILSDKFNSSQTSKSFTFDNPILFARASNTGGYGTASVFATADESFITVTPPVGLSGTLGYVNNISLSSDRKTVTVLGANRGNDLYAEFSLVVVSY